MPVIPLKFCVTCKTTECSLCFIILIIKMLNRMRLNTGLQHTTLIIGLHLEVVLLIITLYNLFNKFSVFSLSAHSVHQSTACFWGSNLRQCQRNYFRAGTISTAFSVSIKPIILLKIFIELIRSFDIFWIYINCIWLRNLSFCSYFTFREKNKQTEILLRI